MNNLSITGLTNSMLNYLMFDPAYLIIGLAVTTVILIIVTIICILKMKKLYKRYDLFMRGKDTETLEDLIVSQLEEIKVLKAEDRANKDAIKILNRFLKSSFQKNGVVKYDAFKGMGGKLSFCLTLLDQNNTGFILNSVHSREGCYNYFKQVKKGETDIALGNEERESLELALK